MAWYRNFYKCEDCGISWEDEWSCCCDDECPNCGVDYSPYDSDDLSAYVEKSKSGSYLVYFSPPGAEHKPAYEFFAESVLENVALALEHVAKDLAKPL